MESDANVVPDTSSWFRLSIVTILLGALWYFMGAAIDVAEIGRNWPKYRCSPAIMPFASFYGHDTAQNFNYCVGNIFTGKVGSFTNPFAGILGILIQNVMKFIDNLSSLRIELATLLGGVDKMFQEMVDRLKLLMSQVRKTGQHMKFLMGRIFGTFYAVIYMGMSALTAGLNFGDTAIFGFLDTFCFAPETLINIQDRGFIKISDVRLGDVCDSNGARVTSIYRFLADGQPMVRLGGIHVSTNHYVRYEGEWIKAGDHPDAVPAGIWSGGPGRPLICLDTDIHVIPLAGYEFSDWDETATSDEDTMILAEKYLNNSADITLARPWLYQPALDGATRVKLLDGTFIRADEICPDMITSMGSVIGIGRRAVHTYVELPDGEHVTPSTLIWNSEKWIRAGILYPDAIVHTDVPRVMTVLVIRGTASIETEYSVMRDMCEVHSPDMELPTSKALNPTTVV
jgi:hypothetical protein